MSCWSCANAPMARSTTRCTRTGKAPGAGVRGPWRIETRGQEANHPWKAPPACSAGPTSTRAARRSSRSAGGLLAAGAPHHGPRRRPAPARPGRRRQPRRLQPRPRQRPAPAPLGRRSRGAGRRLRYRQPGLWDRPGARSSTGDLVQADGGPGRGHAPRALRTDHRRQADWRVLRGGAARARRGPAPGFSC